ncbi:hypothetical protein POUND7_002354 [Theobroma cacao]
MAYPPLGYCCTDCYHGHGGEPCYYGGPLPRPCYETYGRPVYDSWGFGGGDYKPWLSVKDDMTNPETGFGDFQVQAETMEEKKVTTMELKVDLQCRRCYNKVKKVLSKLPQIRDQRFDKKANTVTITVVSCCLEQLRDKLYYKGGGFIKCIKIIKPPTQPPTPTPPPPTPTPQPTPTQPPTPPTPTPPPKPPTPICCKRCHRVCVWGPCCCDGPPPPQPPLPPLYCMRCHRLCVWGPCCCDGPPPPPPPPCCWTFGRPVYDSWSCNVSRGDCSSDACLIM